MIPVQAIDLDGGIAARRMPIYLDHHATPPLDRRVRDAMLPFLGAIFGHVGSAGHRYGWRAQEAVENARARVAALVGAQPAKIVFTAGAAEIMPRALRSAAGR